MRDRFLLILVGCLVLSGILGLTFLLENYFRLARDWEIFVFGVLLYTAATTYLSYQSRLLSTSKNKWIPFALVSLIVISVILIMGGLFKFGIMPLPHSLWPYAIGVLVVSPATVVGVEYYVRAKRNRFTTKKNGLH